MAPVSIPEASSLESAEASFAQVADSERRPLLMDFVGAGAHGQITDEERELHIRAAGQLMQEAMARWEAEGNFMDRGDAAYWLRIQNEAIKGRSAAQVARMEADRGLNGR